MKYVVYLDVLWLENFFMDFFLLWFVCGWRNKYSNKLLRILAASVLGASLSVIPWIYPLKKQELAMYQLISAVLMIAIAISHKGTYRQRISRLCYDVCIFHVLMFIFGGIWHLQNVQKIAGIHSFWGIVLYSFAVILVAFLGMKILKKRNNMICDVNIYMADNIIHVKALFDTGNSLREPVSNRPVSVLEKSALRSVQSCKIDEKWLCIIPYHALGKNGMMIGMKIPQIEIIRCGEVTVCKDVIVAVYSGTLSTVKKYQMILHPDLV